MAGRYSFIKNTPQCSVPGGGGASKDEESSSDIIHFDKRRKNGRRSDVF